MLKGGASSFGLFHQPRVGIDVGKTSSARIGLILTAQLAFSSASFLLGGGGNTGVGVVLATGVRRCSRRRPRYRGTTHSQTARAEAGKKGRGRNGKVTSISSLESVEILGDKVFGKQLVSLLLVVSLTIDDGLKHPKEVAFDEWHVAHDAFKAFHVIKKAFGLHD